VSLPVGWALLAVSAVLFVIAYVRYRGIRDDLISPDASELKGSTARAARSAVYAGRVPEDRQLAVATRALAKRTVNNYPLRWRYVVFTYPAILALALSLFAFLPRQGPIGVAAFVVVGAIVTIQARAAHRGAQRILATKPKR
jgi:hypothetical protein